MSFDPFYKQEKRINKGNAQAQAEHYDLINIAAEMWKMQNVTWKEKQEII